MTISIPQTEKRCTQCNKVKSASEFSKRYTHSLVSACKACHAENKRTRYDTNEAYRQHLLFTYGLSIDQYLDMYLAQDKRCASCRDRLDLRSRKRIAVDHDHKTGQVRGLLCNACNSALGMLKDNPKRVRALARYIQRFQGRKHDTNDDYVQLTLLA